MTVEEVKWLMEVIGKYTVGGLVAGGLVFLLTKNYLSSYLHEKGANLAKKEDIADLTKLVKDVEHQYNVLIQEMQANQQLRMAAVDRRLQAHQEAFTMWHKLVVGDDDETRAVIQCREWWNRNCLYLEPEVRQAFLNACNEEERREKLCDARASHKDILESARKVMLFPDVLFTAIKLPGLTDAERESVKATPESKHSSSTV